MQAGQHIKLLLSGEKDDLEISKNLLYNYGVTIKEEDEAIVSTSPKKLVEGLTAYFMNVLKNENFQHRNLHGKSILEKVARGMAQDFISTFDKISSSEFYQKAASNC